MKIKFQLRVLSTLICLIIAMVAGGLYFIKYNIDWAIKNEAILTRINSNIQQSISEVYTEIKYNDNGPSRLLKLLNQFQFDLKQIDIRSERMELLINTIEIRCNSVRKITHQLDVGRRNQLNTTEAYLHLEDKLFNVLILIQENTVDLNREISTQVKVQSLKQIFNLFSIIVLIGIVPAWANFKISRHIASSLRKLIHTTKEIEHGNLQARTQMNGKDELSDISKSIDRMLDSLNLLTVRRDELESIVNERTALLEQLARLDELTGIYNRRTLMQLCRTEIERCKRYGHPISLIFIDVDHFKLINDQYGHATGDRVLTEISSVLKHSIRESDVLGRYGGEEFAILFIQAKANQALTFTDRLRIKITEHFKKSRYPFEVTISAGIADLKAEMDLNDLLKSADLAMYQAKKSGRNRCVVSHQQSLSIKKATPE